MFNPRVQSNQTFSLSTGTYGPSSGEEGPIAFLQQAERDWYGDDSQLGTIDEEEDADGTEMKPLGDD